jgi:hypothetical protein
LAVRVTLRKGANYSKRDYADFSRL